MKLGLGLGLGLGIALVLLAATLAWLVFRGRREKQVEKSDEVTTAHKMDSNQQASRPKSPDQIRPPPPAQEHPPIYEAPT
jgi:hypothetical protein